MPLPGLAIMDNFTENGPIFVITYAFHHFPTGFEPNESPSVVLNQSESGKFNLISIRYTEN